MPNNPPESILALDFGKVRIGVAVASYIAKLPRPLVTLKNEGDIFGELDKIIEAENVTRIVVGYPRNLNSEVTEQTKAVEQFVEQLKNKIKQPIDTQDEALTSVVAKEELMNSSKVFAKSEVDALAASYILSDWFHDHDKISE